MWSGFYKRDLAQRQERVAQFAALSDLAAWQETLDIDVAEQWVENVVGLYSLPLGVAVGAVVDGEAVVVPMVVEESSVIAAASNGAKLPPDGFQTTVDDPITIGQIEVRNPAVSKSDAERFVAQWMEAANACIPSMIARGGGVRNMEIRSVPQRLVIHVHVDCRNAMGANVVNSLCEALGPQVAADLQGTLGLRILTNLATSRMATATARIPISGLGEGVAEGMIAANDFALHDPFRAATHNKGILNGIDPIAIATGNDWRAIEAGAHAYAALDGYKALTTYHLDGEHLVATLRMPLSVGTVGGLTRLHPGARLALQVLGNPDARRLAAIMVSIGLAQNLSALRALAGPGIQQGHMALHAKNIAAQAGVPAEHVEAVAAAMIASQSVHSEGAKRHLDAIRRKP